MRFDLIFNKLVRDAHEKGKITIYSGEETKSFIHVRDVAHAIFLGIEAHENLISGEVFNLGNSQTTYTFSHIANIIKSILPDTEVNFLNLEPELVNYRISTSKIEKVLDFTPRISIEDSMREILDALDEGLFEDTHSLRYNNCLD